jgi:hypothetical protein
MARFEKRRVGFNYVEYFTSFHLKELLQTPNRRMAGGSTNIYANIPHANSFFTLLYSEVWADHWLYFSGRMARETKLWPKRTLLAFALPTVPIFLMLSAGFIADLVRRAQRILASTRDQKWKERLALLLEKFELDLVPLGLVGLGALLYLYWQTGPALLPGKNSTVKFIYVASLVAPTIALLFRRRLKPLTFNLLSGYLLILFVVAVPVAIFWPS